MFLFKKLFLLLKPFVNRFPKLAAIYRAVRDQLESMDEPKVTPWGFKLAGNLSMAEGSFEPIETELVRNLLDEVDVLVNVGANVGYYCCHALSMGKEVIAFEPMERNLRYLCKNIKANGWNEIEIFPIALSNDRGIIEIFGGNTGASLVKGWAGIPENYRVLVPSSTLDLVLNSRLKGQKVLVLADIEGAELWMLEGGINLLKNDPKPHWLIEITSSENQPDGVKINPNFLSTFELFFSYGYEAFTADQEMRPVTLKEVDLISKDLLQINTFNFLFCESKKKNEY